MSVIRRIVFLALAFAARLGATPAGAAIIKAGSLKEVERYHAQLARGDRIIVMAAIAGILALVAVFKFLPEILPLS